MEVSELRRQLVLSYNNATSPSMQNCFGDYITELDNMMMAVYGKMWDNEEHDYT